MAKRKLKKRIKKSRQKRPFNPSIQDRHHILWQAAHYNCGYAKRLRLYPWLIVLIPRDTLHHGIHSVIGDIPVPPDELCKEAFLELTELESAEKLDYSVPIEVRIDWLLDRFTIDSAPRTYLALLHQKEVVHEFYRTK